MTGLVLKALTLQYIIGLDELVYSAFSSVRFRQLAGNVKFRVVKQRASAAWKMWGINTIKLAALVAYLVFVSWVFSDLRTLHHLCRKYLDVFTEERAFHPLHWLFGKFPAWALP